MSDQVIFQKESGPQPKQPKVQKPYIPGDTDIQILSHIARYGVLKTEQIMCQGRRRIDPESPVYF